MLREEFVCGLFLMYVCYSITCSNEDLMHDYYYTFTIFLCLY